MRLKLLVGLFGALLTASYVNAAEQDTPGSGTGHYYFLGQIHECLTKHSIKGVDNKAEIKKLIQDTSREAIYDKAKRALKATKPQYFDETLDVWLRISARYEEGLDAVRAVDGKDVGLNIDQCNLLLPYIRLNIVKAQKDDYDFPDNGDDNDTYKTWEEIQ